VVTGEPGDAWVEVIVPVRPLQTRWIATDGFTWRAHDLHVHAFLEEFTLEVHRADGSVPFAAPTGIGRPDTPTPLGATFIDDVLPGPSVAFGPWIFSTALFSESINEFGDGLPKVGFHGTNNPASVGDAASNGDLRLNNGDVETLHALLGGGDAAGMPITIWPSAAEFQAAELSCGGEVVTVAGDDVVAAGAGNDIICGLGGNDSIWGQAGDDVIFGGHGDDKLRGGDGADMLDGGDGVDDLNGGRDDDHVHGGEGDDARVRGGTGDDYVTGGPGNDLLVSGNGGRDVVDGGTGDDLVRGGPRPDVLYGGAGADEMQGLGGADTMFGGAGNDDLKGGAQPDTLWGGDGIDACRPGTEGAVLNDCEPAAS